MMNQSLGTCPNFGVHFSVRKTAGVPWFSFWRCAAFSGRY